MKKIIILNIAALLFAGSAFAAETWTKWGDNKAMEFTGGKAGVGIGSYGGLVAEGDAMTAGKIGTLSTNVGLSYRINSTAYAIITQHAQATKAFGSSYDSTRIFVKTVKKGEATAAPTDLNSKQFEVSNGWKSL